MNKKVEGVNKVIDSNDLFISEVKNTEIDRDDDLLDLLDFKDFETNSTEVFSLKSFFL